LSDASLRKRSAVLLWVLTLFSDWPSANLVYS